MVVTAVHASADCTDSTATMPGITWSTAFLWRDLHTHRCVRLHLGQFGAHDREHHKQLHRVWVSPCVSLCGHVGTGRSAATALLPPYTKMPGATPCPAAGCGSIVARFAASGHGGSCVFLRTSWRRIAPSASWAVRTR